jgi:branched-chain amino acid transport system substrate-binding protein
MPAVRLLLLLLALLLLAGCGSSSKAKTADERSSLVVLVNAPFSRTPYLGRAIENGARLAAREVNANGIRVGGKTYDLKIETLDSGLSPARAVANVRRAVGRHAVAIVDEGTGVDASWRIAGKSGVPIGVVFEGGSQVIDPVARPNVFRVAPTDHGIAFRLAEYLIPKGLHIALLHDDSDYGSAGEDALRSAFSRNQSSIAGDYAVPADALDVAPQVLRARRAHATALLVWGRPATVAATITAARTAGWNVPIYTSPTGADPFVRQQLADHPGWIDGLTFAGGRLTAEVGTGPFQTFEQKMESAYGVDRVGVKTKAGDEVIQPPETAMYAYDFVNLIAAAILHAGSTDPERVTKALNEVTVQGANGDQRGFNQHNHEGVIDDDVYFARFQDMTYAPVQDDPLSKTLPTVNQIR